MVWKILLAAFSGLLLIGALMYIILPGIKDSNDAQTGMQQSILGSPKLELNNSYKFTAEQITVTTLSKDCTIKKSDGTGKVIELECKTNAEQAFSINIKNNNFNHETLAFLGGLVVCKLGDKNCCENAQTLSATSSGDCILTKGDIKPCATETFKFDGTYQKYEVHPAAECIFDPRGCYDPGMTSSVKSCNPNTYVTVTMI
jgi:hypothetical protein